MPTFDTPKPISVTIEIGVGDVRIVAGDRTDTVVAVAPTDADKQSNVTAAAQTRVEYDDGRLVIKAPKGWRQWSLRGGAESVDVQIDLPAGSDVRGQSGIGSFRCTGRLGECHLKTAIGEISVDEAGPVELHAAMGDIVLGRALDHADLTTRSGVVRAAKLDATAVIKNSNGDSWIGEAGGELRVNAANGRIAVDQARAGVAAKTANGDVRLGEVAHGAVLAQTANGKLEIGIRAGVAAWLDLNTSYGNVLNSLDAADRPRPDEATVEVRARTSFGDITVRRSPAGDVAHAA